jgi:hypothetical protein
VTQFDSKVQYVRGVRFHDRNLGVIFEERGDTAHYPANLVTSDGGATWERRVVTNREFVSSWFKLEFTDSRHLWFANQQGLWLSKDTARTWQLCDSISTFNSAFEMIDSLRGVCDGLPNGPRVDIAYTVDCGVSWTHIAKPYPNQTLDLAVIDPYASGIPPAVFSGYDGALAEIRGGYVDRALNSYTRDPLLRISVVRSGRNADVWVLGSSFQVLHASYVITDVQAGSNLAPSGYAVEQNFPNPFNPSTVISFQVPTASHVKLVVYDILGREVEVLVNEKKAPGTYQVQFNASRLASGVYLYRIQADQFNQSRKMIVLK